MRSLFIPAAVIALISQLVILRSVLLGRAPASAPGKTARFAEIAWVVLPTVTLALMLFFTWQALSEPVALAPVNGVTV